VIRGDNGLRSIRAKCGVAAVVKQDYIATPNLACNFAFYVLGWLASPVPTGNIPHYGLESQGMSGSQGCWAPSPERGTKQARMFSYRISECPFALLQLRKRFLS